MTWCRIESIHGNHKHPVRCTTAGAVFAWKQAVEYQSEMTILDPWVAVGWHERRKQQDMNQRNDPHKTPQYKAWRRTQTEWRCQSQQESRAVARKPRDAAAVLFGLKIANNIHYKFKSNQALKARLQSSKHTGAKPNLTQNGHSVSFKVTCFGVSGEAIRTK